MSVIKHLLILSSLIQIAEAQTLTKRSNLSYSKTIFDSNYQTSFKKDLGNSCFSLLYNHYKNGGNLHCESLSQKGIPLNYYTDNKQIYLFHYSLSKEAYNLFQNKNLMTTNLSNFFSFYRKRNDNNSSPYVATDPLSSKGFGNFLIRFRINSNAKILVNKDTETVQNCANELESRIPQFSKTCQIKFFEGDNRPDALKLALMIMEDSGIALYDYHYGEFYRNHTGCVYELNPSWLQLTGPEWITDVKSFLIDP